MSAFVIFVSEYLAGTAAIALACAALAIVVMRRLAARPDLEALRTRRCHH